MEKVDGVAEIALKNNWIEYYTILVDPNQTPIRLDKYLMDKLERISRNRIQKGIANGQVYVDNKIRKSSYKVQPQEEIRVFLPQKIEDKDIVIAEDIPLDIRYEDDDIMIVHKQAGMVVHPGVGNWSGTLVNGLRYYLEGKDLPVMEGNPMDRPGLVHRIDKETSGLLVIAKNKEAMTHLSKQFFDHSIDRTYKTLVWGEPDPYEGQITGYIGRDERHRKNMFLYDEESKGKWSVTNYKVIEPLYYVSLVECRLETGRTHQIRVHMQSKRNPVFNDKKYGGDRVIKGTVFSKYKQFVENCFSIIDRQALHAASLGFIHPTTGEKMYFESELPQDMSDVLEKWRGYTNTRKEMKK